MAYYRKGILMSAFASKRWWVVAVVGVILIGSEPAWAGGFSLPNLGVFNFLAPVIRGFFLLILRLIFLIPGGENFLIDLT